MLPYCNNYPNHSLRKSAGLCGNTCASVQTAVSSVPYLCHYSNLPQNFACNVFVLPQSVSGRIFMFDRTQQGVYQVTRYLSGYSRKPWLFAFVFSPQHSKNFVLLCARLAENVALTGRNRSSEVGRLMKNER